jgi:hypothetical protein
MSTSRIGGDYSAEALEAFRAAYAAQMQTPEDLETDTRMGLPTGEISNTAPWIHTTGLWKYPSGKGPEDDLKAPFDPNNFFTRPEEEEEAVDISTLSDEELDEYLDSLSEDDLIALNEELDSIVNEDSSSGETMSDEEIENLIAELNDED